MVFHIYNKYLSANKHKSYYFYLILLSWGGQIIFILVIMVIPNKYLFKCN